MKKTTKKKNEAIGLTNYAGEEHLITACPLCNNVNAMIFRFEMIADNCQEWGVNNITPPPCVKCGAIYKVPITLNAIVGKPQQVA